MNRIAICLMLIVIASCARPKGPATDAKSSPSTAEQKAMKAKMFAEQRATKTKNVLGPIREKLKARVLAAQAARAKLPPRTAFKTAITATPVCDGVFHWVNVPGMTCIDGSATGYEYLCPVGNTATSPLLLFQWGNGACIDGDSCDCQPDPITGVCTSPTSLLFRGISTIAQSDDGLPLAASTLVANSTVQGGNGPFAAFVGPNSPFTSGNGDNIVSTFSCQGDAGTGSVVNQKFKKSMGGNIRIWFNGYATMNAMLASVQTLFPQPSRLAAWGDSSGGLGMDCSLQKIRNIWPAANMYEMADASPGFFVSTIETGLIPITNTWGFANSVSGRMISKTCPLDPAMSDPSLFAYSIEGYNRRFVPSVRKSYSDDYFDATLTFFAEFVFGPYPSSGLTYTDGLIAGTGLTIINNNQTDILRTQPYATALTNDDQQNFGVFNLPAAIGQTIDAGTCITPGSSNTGNNFIRLFDPTGTQVASDNASCPGGGAHISFVVATAGQHTLRLGCSGNTVCGGVAAAHTTGATNTTFSPLAAPAAYTASNTNNATVNYKSATVYLEEGQTIDLGTCGVDNSIAIGDTYLRLFSPSNVQVAFNDDACGGRGSRLQYTVPPGARGLYTIRQGCKSNLSCGGYTAYYVIGDTLYKAYLHGDLVAQTGDCHSERNQDGNPEPACDYNVMTQAGTAFNDWVRSWMEVPTFTNWINVQ